MGHSSGVPKLLTIGEETVSYGDHSLHDYTAFKSLTRVFENPVREE